VEDNWKNKSKYVLNSNVKVVICIWATEWQTGYKFLSKNFWDDS